MSTKHECCPDCNAGVGELHVPGCDVERCPYCGGQVFLGLCCGQPLDERDRMPWTGLWPGEADCREFGWYVRMVPGVGWERCAAGEPGAREDLNRLYMEAIWDPAQKRHVLPKSLASPEAASEESEEPS
jgi:hypothetical protein